MSITKADLILHPIRLKIVTEMARHSMTTGEIAALLPHVARATLYRHIKQLAEGGVLEIVGEAQVNGAIERTYRVTKDGGRLTAENIANTSPETHTRYFTTFVASLIDTFADYIHHTHANDIFEDGLTYSRTVVHLSEDERAQFQSELVEIVERMLILSPAPFRRRYTLAQTVIPEPQSPEKGNKS